MTSYLPAGNRLLPATGPATPAPTGWPPDTDLTPLWPLLERQMALYTCGDSTSLPVETAGELLASVLFCLQVAAEANAAPPPTAASLAEQLLAGQRILTRETDQAKRLLAQLRATPPAVTSRAYRDSLRALAHFFTHHDLRFFAHRPPALLDYPLYLPVPESLHGVRYAAAWLRALSLENRLCRCFPADVLQKRLAAHHPDWQELHLNLFEPVFTSALGLALVGGHLQPLSLSTAERDKLYALFHPARGAFAPPPSTLLPKAVGRLCSTLRLWDSATRRGLLACAQALLPQLHAASRQGFERLFPAL